MKAGKLPKAIAGGAKRQDRRAMGGPLPPTTTKSILRSIVPVKAVTPPPAIGSVDRSVKVPVAMKPGRLTALNVVQTQRDKGRARAAAASPLEALRSFGRQARSVKRSKMGASTELTRRNPPSPMADLNRGRLRYSGAFAAGAFRAPFQKSWNSRRSFGA